MADISRITLPSGTTYEIKDAVARAGINGIFVIAWNGTSTPIVDNIPAGVVVRYSNTNYTGTLAAGPNANTGETTLGKFYLVKAPNQGDNQETLDIYDEYVTVQTGSSYSWEKIGDTQIKLTAMVTDVTLNKQTSTVIGNQATFTVTQPAFNVTPTTTYLKASASGGAVTASGDNVTALTGLGTLSKEAVLTGVTVASQKLQTTGVIGVKSNTTTASKAAAGTTQTTATGASTNSTTNTDWLKGVSVNNEVLTIGAATLNTQQTTQYTFSDVTVPIKADDATTVANGSLVATSNTANVGGTIVTSVTTPNTNKVSAVTDIPSPSTDTVIGTGSTLSITTNPTISLATDASNATGRVNVATGISSVNRTTDVGVGWNSKDEKTVLNNSTTLTVSHPS